MNIDTKTLHPALSNARQFCDIIADAASLGLAGFWYGSAYRSHPRGIIRDGLIFTNEWNINHYCSINALNNPQDKIPPVMNAPASYGNPHPQPPSGKTKVWDGYGGFKIDGPWVQKASNILYALEQEIKEKSARLKEEEEKEKLRQKEENEIQIEKLRQAHS